MSRHNPQAQALEERLTACRQTLECASIALGASEDQGFSDGTAATAVRVIERCVEELTQIENSLQRHFLDQRSEAS